MNLVDSSGWLEYFADETNADFFAPAIEDIENLLVSSINIYEVFKRVLQQKGEDAALEAVSLMQQGQVVDLNSSIAIRAANISNDLKLPLADSVILATTRMYNAILFTQDSDFEDIEGIKYITKKKVT